MSTEHEQDAPQPSPGDVETLELYGRCKALTLAAGASLLLDRPELSLRRDALALAEEVQAIATASERRRAQLAGIHDAALALAEMLEQKPADRVYAIDRARLAQRELRLQLGSILAPQFAPCGAHERHAEAQGV